MISLVVNFLKLVCSISGMGDNVAIFDGTKNLPPGTHCQSVNAAFCMTCSLLMMVEDARGHME